MREQKFLDQVAVTVEFHTQLINSLNNIESEKSIRDHPSNHRTLIVSVLNVSVKTQIRASYVDQMIISFKIVLNRTLRIRKFAGTRKSLKLVRID